MGILAAPATIGEFLMGRPTHVRRVRDRINAHRMARKERKRKNERPPKNK